jgi:acyl transferase domain-containing protein
LPVADVRARLGDRAVSVAAINGPRSVVVSGDPAALDVLFDELTADDVRVRRIAVDYASHSVQVEDLRAELLEVLAPITPQSSPVPFFSTVTGEWLDTVELDADYWYRSLRQTVEFAPAVDSLLGEQFRVFVEVSSHPVLTMALVDAVEEADAVAVVAGSLRRDQGGLDRFLTSLAELFVRGVAVDWSPVFEAIGRRRRRRCLRTGSVVRSASVAGCRCGPGGLRWGLVHGSSVGELCALARRSRGQWCGDVPRHGVLGAGCPGRRPGRL